MSYNGSGSFSINTAGQPVVSGTTITSTAFNLLTADLATGLSTAICKDGQTTTTASIPFAVGIAVTTGITTPSTSFALVNTTATTVNFAGGATVAINAGGAGNTTTWTATSFVHTGTLTVSGTSLTLTGGNVIMGVAGDNKIGTNTADGADNAKVWVSGGGAFGDNTRGGYIALAGNENGSTGSVTIEAGNATGGIIEFRTNNALQAKVSGPAFLFGSANTDYKINPTTADASDNARLFVSGGGAYGDVTRGSYIGVYGNESASTGSVDITAGNVAGGIINFNINAGVLEWKIDRTAGASRIVSGVRIGVDSTNNLLDDASNGAGTATLFIGNASINVTSDMRMKPYREPTTRDTGAIIDAMEVVDHNWKSDSVYGYMNDRGLFMGVLAQQVQPLAPWAVNKPGKEEDLWFVEHVHLVPMLIEEIKRLRRRVASLET